MLKSKVYVVKSAGKESKEVAIINTEIQIPPNPYSFGIYLPKVKKKKKHENNTTGCQCDAILLTQRR